MPRTMSALGQKQTYAVQNGMSALHPIATEKADFRNRSFRLLPPKADMCSAPARVRFGQNGHFLGRSPFRVFIFPPIQILFRRPTYFLMRQVDRDVLSLRVAIEHPFE